MKNRTAYLVCLYKKIFSHTRKEVISPLKEVKLYDAILFNYEGEKRVDIVTSIEEFKTMGEVTLVFGTCVHGLIGERSVERNLGSIS